MTLTPLESILGGLLFIVTVRMIGNTLGRQHQCHTMRMLRIVFGTVLYAAAGLAIVAGLMGIG